MTRHSLRLRLLAGAALAILMALVIAGIGMTWLFERHIERREGVSLEAKANELISGLSLDRDGRPVVAPLPSDNRFMRAASGLYWQATTDNGALHSTSLWDQSLPLPKGAMPSDWTLRRGAGPFGRPILILERGIRPDRSHRIVLVQMATDDAALRDARGEFARETAISLTLLWLVLTLAAYGQVTLGLRPLWRLQDEVGQLRRNATARISGDNPREVMSLIDAINALADARSADVERARRRAADLAHSLKTPLAALSAQSRRAREAGAGPAADGLDRAIAAAAATLEAELARARAGLARDTDRSVRSDMAAVAERIIAVIERTERGELLVFETEIAAGATAPLSDDALAEMLGALVENAAYFARRQVRISGGSGSEGFIVTVGDDGPGIADAQAAAALVRGQRLDEAGPGHGFGLAIVRDLCDATGGHLSLGTSALGGLEVTIHWAAQSAVDPGEAPASLTGRLKNLLPKFWKL